MMKRFEKVMMKHSRSAVVSETIFLIYFKAALPIGNVGSMLYCMFYVRKLLTLLRENTHICTTVISAGETFSVALISFTPH